MVLAGGILWQNTNQICFSNTNRSIIKFDIMSERQVRSVGRSCDTVASFLIKTYEILEHPEFEYMISWEKDGVGFVVKDVVAFTREILPKYFRHGNFSSFVRQLNMYDFHKVKQDNDNLVFKNPLFRKGEQGQLKDIKRKAAKKPFNGHVRRHDKIHPENEKYFSTLKTLKKSVENQINQSSVHYQKSLTLLKDNSESNKLKIKLIEDLDARTAVQGLDSLFLLKEECYRYFNRIEDWLAESLQAQNKKQQMVASCISQLKKSKEQLTRPKNADSLSCVPLIANRSVISFDSPSQV